MWHLQNNIYTIDINLLKLALKSEPAYIPIPTSYNMYKMYILYKHTTNNNITIYRSIDNIITLKLYDDFIIITKYNDFIIKPNNYVKYTYTIEYNFKSSSIDLYNYPKEINAIKYSLYNKTPDKYISNLND